MTTRRPKVLYRYKDVIEGQEVVVTRYAMAEVDPDAELAASFNTDIRFIRQLFKKNRKQKLEMLGETDE